MEGLIQAVSGPEGPVAELLPLELAEEGAGRLCWMRSDHRD